MKSLIVTALALLAVVASAVGQTQADTDEPAALESITVTPRHDPLYEPDQLLRVMLERSLPCLGCDAAPVAARHNVADQLLHYLLLPAAPPEPDAIARMAFEQKIHDAPDLEYLAP